MYNVGDFNRPEKYRAVIVAELRIAGITDITTHEYTAEFLKPGCKAHSLAMAGISCPLPPEDVRTETVTCYDVTAQLHGWTFGRRWYYWSASCKDSKNAIPLDDAKVLFEKFPKDLRLDGDCGCPPPTHAAYLYHIDTQDALNALTEYLTDRAAKTSVKE